MKCPKCGYLGFEPVERCRNCGYDFSLIPRLNGPELPLRSALADAMPPLDDLVLAEAGPAETFEPLASVAGDFDRKSSPKSNRGIPELPLFGLMTDDLPLITRPSPRQPLSVRRPTPEVARLRTEQRALSTGLTPMLDLGLAEDTPAPDPLASGGAGRTDRSTGTAEPGMAEPAGLGARLLAVLIDLVVLAATDLLVVYFTMQICGLPVGDLGILPKGPLIAFLLVQNGGYLVAFTTGGQTLGKMCMGIRVVSTDPAASVDLGHSMVRTIVWVLLAVPAGLGFVTALFSCDRRGLHDRCAGTRVVRAGA